MEGIWILNAPGHRLAELQQLVVGIAEATAADPKTEHVVIDGGEAWVCDRCNGTVDVFQPDGHGGPDPTRLPPEGRLNPVPVVNGQVLCCDCFVKVMGGNLAPANRWPGCGCEPCQAATGRQPAAVNG